jgi:hypothetical protein
MGSVVLFKLVVTNSNNPKTVPATIGTIMQQESERSTAVPSRFDVGTNIQGQTVVSDITSLAEEQAKSCLLTRCITREVFPFYKFVLLDSELDYGGRLQKRICSKLSVTHDDRGYWEMNREKVRTKLTRKRNNVTEAVRKKMTGKWMHK